MSHFLVAYFNTTIWRTSILEYFLNDPQAPRDHDRQRGAGNLLWQQNLRNKADQRFQMSTEELTGLQTIALVLLLLHWQDIWIWAKNGQRQKMQIPVYKCFFVMFGYIWHKNLRNLQTNSYLYWAAADTWRAEEVTGFYFCHTPTKPNIAKQFSEIQHLSKIFCRLCFKCWIAVLPRLVLIFKKWCTRWRTKPILSTCRKLLALHSEESAAVS